MQVGQLGRLGLQSRRNTIPFSPRSIDAVVWYDPSDLSTLFQDSAGTTPVTAVGQQVGRMLDKSGRGNHAAQATLTSRPILQKDANGRYHLSCDGVDDCMVTSTIDLTATDKVTICAGVRKLSDAASGIVAEFSPNINTNAGSFNLLAPIGIDRPGFQGAGFRSSGTTATSPPDITGFVSPATAVLTGIGNVSGDSAILRINGSQASSSTTDQGTGNYGNHQLFLFRRAGASLSFNGRFYGLAIVPSLLSDTNLTWLETYMNRKTGAY